MISARIVADSESEGHGRITTFELEYPRYIHAEVMTHRVFSRNAASSRAIPIKRLIEQVENNTVMPIWTQNQAGMQGSRITNGNKLVELDWHWAKAAKSAIEHATQLQEAGAHKQNVNRLLEPFQHIKVVLTATEFSNFFNLRVHEDAQPEIYELAKEMQRLHILSTPKRLYDGGWHLPYAPAVSNLYTLEDCKAISASCCAQVSYRKSDDTLEKAQDIYSRLVDSEVLHASPFEHQATPSYANNRNFNGWDQLRHLIEENHTT